MKALVTGSNGLIGSQASIFFIERGYEVIGIDNDMRSYFFGSSASTAQTGIFLENYDKFSLYALDIRDYEKIEKLFKNNSFDIVIHTAAQPSHDWASKEPLTDFSINAVGTMNLLELTRLYSSKATFIFTSTNKVYGDRPNFSYYSKKYDPSYKNLLVSEEQTRYEGRWNDGTLASIDEKMPIDSCTHSLFGASKVAADVMVQEYGRYFGMNTAVFRGGCLTGPNHQGTELHGFLSYLIKCIVRRKEYKILGYKGKQVRDNIHSWDLVNMFWHYHQNPIPGKVYNAGGGRENSISILEAIQVVNNNLHKIDAREEWLNFTISEDNRIGDHVWYISDISKFKKDYPSWPGITISVEEIIHQIIEESI